MARSVRTRQEDSREEEDEEEEEEGLPAIKRGSARERVRQ